MILRFLTSHKLAEELGCTVSSIYNHIHRKNFNAIPRPIRLGRKLIWPREAVEEWLENKMKESEGEKTHTPKMGLGKKGRPTKTEQRKRRIDGEAKG